MPGLTLRMGFQSGWIHDASALSGEVDAAFARAYAPIALTFPQDHGAHPQYQTEWWYFTGNLADERGNDYGYQFTIFRSALTPEMPARASDLATNQIYMAHFAITDGAANEHPAKYPTVNGQCRK